MFECFCNKLLELNEKVDAVQKRLQEFSTKPSDLDSSSILFPSVCESFSSCTKTRKTIRRKNGRRGKKRREIVMVCCFCILYLQTFAYRSSSSNMFVFVAHRKANLIALLLSRHDRLLHI